MRGPTLMWIDLEDPKASTDKKANAAFAKKGFDVCSGRIFSGCYANETSLDNTVGEELQLPGYPYFRASGDGVADVNDVPRNGMHVTYEQFRLDVMWDGHKVDIDCRRLPDGTIEYGIDMSNWTEMPPVQWFVDRWNDANLPIRFVIFGDQMPYITAAQMANCAATGLDFEAQLYTYINFPGGDYYSGLDAGEQVTRAMDALGVPPAQPENPNPTPTPQASPEWSSFAVLGDKTFNVTIREVN